MTEAVVCLVPERAQERELIEAEAESTPDYWWSLSRARVESLKQSSQLFSLCRLWDATSRIPHFQGWLLRDVKRVATAVFWSEQAARVIVPGGRRTNPGAEAISNSALLQPTPK